MFWALTPGPVGPRQEPPRAVSRGLWCQAGFVLWPQHAGAAGLGSVFCRPAAVPSVPWPASASADFRGSGLSLGGLQLLADLVHEHETLSRDIVGLPLGQASLGLWLHQLSPCKSPHVDAVALVDRWGNGGTERVGASPKGPAVSSGAGTRPKAGSGGPLTSQPRRPSA